MPDHKFQNKEDWKNYCKICGDHSYELDQERELNLYNHKRFYTDGYESMHTSPDALAFYFDQILRLEHNTPTKADLIIWQEIKDLLFSAQDFKSANDLEKGLSSIKIFKSNKIERRAFLETLSIAGIIETKEHKGYFAEYIPQIKRENRPNGASPNGWSYPILWWKGSDGINRKALDYWFGNY